MFPSPGPGLAAERRFSDDIYPDCSNNSHSSSRLKEKPYEHYTLVHREVSDVCSHPRLHGTRDSKASNQALHHEGASGERGPSCPLLSGVGLEQRRRLCMMEAPYGPPAAGYPHPADGAAPHQHRSAEEDRRTLGGGAQAPYMSMNFHKVLGKHGSVTTLSHLTDPHSSGSSPESHREIPHYIGTSVIITNER